MYGALMHIDSTFGCYYKKNSWLNLKLREICKYSQYVELNLNEKSHTNCQCCETQSLEAALTTAASRL